MRFRKSISICKGVKLNFSKSGISATVGGKGISANLGKSGIYLNTSIPGTGLYDRKRIVKFDSTPGRKTTTSRVASKGTPAKPKTAAAALPESVTLALGDDGAVQVFDQDGAQVRDLSVLAKLKSTASYRQAYDQLTEQSIAEANADTEAFVNRDLTLLKQYLAGEYHKAMCGILKADESEVLDYETIFVIFLNEMFLDRFRNADRGFLTQVLDAVQSWGIRLVRQSGSGNGVAAGGKEGAGA